MEFFAKMGERLYPVGRLDYLSEGLLLVTNDGELANGLTRAASGVEKTYLVKVAASRRKKSWIGCAKACSDRTRQAGRGQGPHRSGAHPPGARRATTRGTRWC